MADATPFQDREHVLRPADAGQAEIVLKPTEPADAETLGSVVAAMDPWARNGATAAMMTWSLAASDQNRRCFTIWHGADRAGAVVVRHPWLTGPYLNLLAVVPAFQGRGLGGLALAWMETEARASGARNCFLCVAAFNDAARAFYRRNGYTDAALLDDLIKDGEDEILMRKRLQSAPASR